MTFVPSLDEQQLREQLVWQTRNYETALRNLWGTIDWFTSEAKRATERVDWQDGTLGITTESDVAAEVAAKLANMVGNLDLRALVGSAADVTTTKSVLAAIAQLDDFDRQQLDQSFAEQRRARAEKAAAEKARREKRDAEQCQARVSDASRCARKGTVTVQHDGREYRACAQHAVSPRFHPYTTGGRR